MPSPIVYLVTGANRPKGIGFGLVNHILEKHENAFVYAATRDPENAIALRKLSSKYPGRISIVKCDYRDTEGIARMAKQIKEGHGRVDTVIANAGVAGAFGLVHEIPVEETLKSFEVNTIGAIVLFQKVYRLLKKSANPRFVTMSSIAACLTTGIIETKIGAINYGTSKAALNWLTRKMHSENDWLVAFPLHPGVVATDMLAESSKNEPTGIFKKKYLTGSEPSSAEAAGPLLRIIDESTRDKDGGNFVSVDADGHGSIILPW